jgi:hypothetical protein
MKKTAAILLLAGIISCTNNSNKNRAFVPSSSGNLNNVTVIMPQKEWQGNLGDQVREALGRAPVLNSIHEPKGIYWICTPKQKYYLV